MGTVKSIENVENWTMSRNRAAYWTKSPSDMLKQLIDGGEFSELSDKANLKRSKDRKDFGFFWEATFKGQKYKAGGYDEASAREACFEKLLRAAAPEYQWDAPPPLAWACRRPNPELEFVEKMKKLRRKKDVHWSYSHNAYNGVTHVLTIMDIGKEQYAALNKTYKIILPKSGVKDHFGKCRVMDEFLENFNKLKTSILKAQADAELVNEGEDEQQGSNFEPAWASIETLHGVMNAENRFVKVEPRDFADCRSHHEWRQYFERLAKREAFKTKQQFLGEDKTACLLTLETRPPITVVGNGATAADAEIAAMKLAIYDLQIACGNY